MCGIAAAIDWPGAEETVKRIILGLEHRGELTDPLIAPSARAAFCTRRLPITDPEGGTQPVLSHDGRLLLVFNGQIYNHAALRSELEALGVRHRSQCDSEVLANALQTWGPAALRRLRGMYAFVAYDLASGAFLAARDPFGQKPLYVIQAAGGWAFASEIRPLLEACPEGEAMLLPPGHLLARTVLRPFFRLPESSGGEGQSEPAILDAALQDAVEMCVPSQGPLGLFFSGGIDSTLVAHYARRIQPNLRAYFLGGPDAPDHPFAAAYAEETGLDLRIVAFEADDAATLRRLPDLIGALESFEPSVVRPGLCTYLLSEHAHQEGVRVVLTGEGADELFCGYEPLEVLFAASEAAGRDLRDQCLSQLGRSALQRTDRAAMRFQLEARSPFLDPEVCAHALGLSGQGLLRTVRGRSQGKAPLRALFDRHPGRLPPAIRDRDKRALNEGAGLDVDQTDSWLRRAVEAGVSDAEFKEARREYAAYDLRTKEEVVYLRLLADHMDISRAPHLKGRLRLEAAPTDHPQALALARFRV